VIKINYLGGLGNNLFQYCFGRILAEEMGYTLLASPIFPFEGTCQSVVGETTVGDLKILDGHIIDLPSILECRHSDSQILINGFFQRYEYYKPYKQKIREEWLTTTGKLKKRSKTDAVVHIRRGDYIQCGYTLTANSYHKMLNHIEFSNLYIVTDDINDQFLRNFDRYKPEIVSSDQINDFQFLMSFDNIVISQSTFSWWAAFLSDASNIVVPQTLNGIWGSETRPDINLKVLDDSRYKHVESEIE